MTLAFGYRFGHAWRTHSGGLSSDQPYPWPITIGGMGFVVDLAHYSRVPPEAFRSAQDNGQEPGEASLNPEGDWKRNRADWTLGAGQQYADDDGAFGFKSNPRRYLASKGIDSLSTRRQFTLHHATALSLSSAASGLQVLTCGAYAYVLDGANLRHTTDPYAGSPSWTAVSIAATHSSNATSDGATVWVANGTGVRTTVAGSGTSAYMGNQAATFAADHIAYANGWLIGSKDGRIAEISADGHMAQAGQLDYTHPAVGWKWVGIAGTPNGIYAAGFVGDYGAVYFIGVDNTGKLTVPALATELARGETPTCLAYYGERVFVGSSRGFHLCEVLATDGLAMGPLIIIGHPVQCVDGQGRFVFFGWSNYDGISSGLGRAEMDEMIQPDVPGYASDLMAGDSTTPRQGTVASVATFGGRRLFTVDGVGVFAEALTYVASGTLDTGWWTFGLFEPKAFASVEVVTAPLAGTVGVAIVDQAETSTPIGTLSRAGTTNNGLALSTGGLTGEQVRVVVTLARAADATKAPVVRRYTFRAMPIPALVEAWQLPIMLESTVAVGPDQTIKNKDQDVRAKLQFLRDLMVTQRTVYYQEGADRHRVVVRNVALPEGQAKQWVPRSRTAIEGTYLVKLISVDVGT